MRVGGQPLGFAFAFANCALFAVYIVLAHRIAQGGSGAGVDGLGGAMLIALVVVTAVLGQLPSLAELLGIGLVVLGVAVQRERSGKTAVETAE